MKKKQWIYLPYLLPLLVAIYVLYLNSIDNQASLTRIDPEFLCLLNGLNVSTFQFSNIGYTDLPGTPFLVITGIFIRIIHLIFGQGGIVDDVILRPDFYIQACSYLLLLVSTIIFIWGGKKILKETQSIFAMLTIQGSLLLSPVCFNLLVRYNADRFLPLLVFIFAVYTISYLFNSISSKKYALLAGIILGIGVITKFNFIVLTIIPVIILNSYKHWLRYIAAFFVSAFFAFLPIIDKFQNVWRFITRLLLYEGSYGGGDKGILNFDQLINASKRVIQLNDSFVILFAISFVSAFIFLIKYKSQKPEFKKVLFLISFLLAAIIEVVLASKSFKNYYLAPVLGLLGIVFFINWHLIVSYWKINKKWSTLAGAVFFIAISIPTIIQVNSMASFTKARIENRKKTVEFVQENISSTDYLFFEPAWISGPMPANGLMFGISYVAAKNDFTNAYLKHYPNILSYEGDNKPIKQFRTKDADIATIFKPGNYVYLFSTPGRNTKRLLQELKKQAQMVDMRISPDTVFINPRNNDMFIKTSFTRISSTEEPLISSVSFSNNMEGTAKNWSQKAITTEKAFSGSTSSKIELADKTSSIFDFDIDTLNSSGVKTLSISCKYFQEKVNTKPRIIIDVSSNNSSRFWYTVYCCDYVNKVGKWDDLIYKIYLPEILKDADHVRVYFYNTSKSPVYIDDINIKFTYKL